MSFSSGANPLRLHSSLDLSPNVPDEELYPSRDLVVKIVVTYKYRTEGFIQLDLKHEV